MPWRELSVMEQREEFVRLASVKGANKSELCRRFGISRDKGYKWLRRYQAGDRSSLCDRSRRPHQSPLRTNAATEAEVLRIRARSNNAWGARKIARVMETSGWATVPALSTITEILRRHGKLVEKQHEHPGPFQRFERSAPNDLWQMDFKGHFPTMSGRCHPLTVLDDHSRYAPGLEACDDEQDQTVRARLTRIFRHYGMPREMLMDNGPPWGDGSGGPYTAFTIWLLLLGIHVIHGRPYHPQTQGKDERFHRTLAAEVLFGRSFHDTGECQQAFDRWRHIYNHERPHQALALEPPVSRYRVSPRAFPETLPAVEYGAEDIVRKVDSSGMITLRGRAIRIGKAFRGQRIAIREAQGDTLSVHFCHQQIGVIELRAEPPCGVVDIAMAMPTTPQGKHQQQV